MWNKPPILVCETDTLSIFQTRLKAFLFDQAYRQNGLGHPELLLQLCCCRLKCLKDRLTTFFHCCTFLFYYLSDIFFIFLLVLRLLTFFLSVLFFSTQKLVVASRTLLGYNTTSWMGSIDSDDAPRDQTSSLSCYQHFIFKSTLASVPFVLFVSLLCLLKPPDGRDR